MGCVETKEIKDFEVSIKDFYSSTRQRFSNNKETPQAQELKLTLDLQHPSSYTLYTRSNSIPFFRKDKPSTKSTGYFPCPTEDLSLDHSSLWSTCNNSFRSKNVS